MRNSEHGAWNTGRLCPQFWLAFLLLTGCHAPQPSARDNIQRFGFSSTHMGTMFQITLYALDAAAARSATDVAFARVAALDNIMSDYQADSELMQLCEAPQGRPVRVSAELFDVLEKAQRFSTLSHGAFDVTVGPYVRLWRVARKKKTLPAPGEISAAAAAVGYNKLHLDRRQRTVTLLAPNMRLDLGGIAKGYAADQALAVLKGRGLTRALVAASGDIAVGDPPPGQPGWKVAITGLTNLNGENTGTLLLNNAGISTSGDTEQYVEIGGKRYSHIVNPRTGLGLTQRIQVTVIGPNATTSDALATGVSVLGPECGLALVDSLPHTAALALSRDNGKDHVLTSRRFAAIPIQK